MVLTCRILDNVVDVNTFEEVDVARFTQGDGPTVYFQLVDLSKGGRTSPPGRRYVPAAGATLEVTVDNINDAKKITRFASQPYATKDGSIWALSFMSTDTISGTAALRLKLTEGSKVTRGNAENIVSIQMSTTLLPFYGKAPIA